MYSKDCTRRHNHWDPQSPCIYEKQENYYAAYLYFRLQCIINLPTTFMLSLLCEHVQVVAMESEWIMQSFQSSKGLLALYGNNQLWPNFVLVIHN